jgi:outer membrane cobalamin receptor
MERQKMEPSGMEWIRTVIFSMALIMILHTGATAEETNATPADEQGQTSSQQLEPITVVDKAASQRPDLDPDSLTNPYRIEASGRFGTEVFTRQDVQDLQPIDINDLLEKATGINVTYQGRKSPYFISQRGGGSFTYIIDGAVLPPSSNRILYKIPLSAIEEMQIVRGATSLSLGPTIPIGASNSGSGLNTGFIIIRTKQPQKTQAVLTGSAEQSKGGHPLATNVSLYAGTRVGAASSVDGYLGAVAFKMDRPSQDSWFDGRSGEGGMANTGFRAGKFNLNLMGYKDSGRFEMQRGIAVDGTLSDAKWYYDPLKTTLFSSDMAMQWTPNQITLLNLFQTKFEQTEHNDSFTSPATTTKNYSEDTKGIGLRHNARFGDTLLQVGGQMSNSTGFGPNTSKSYNKYDTTVTGWSASVEQKLLNGDLVLDGGYRQDTKHIENSSTSVAKNDANHDVDMAPAEVYALGAHWRIKETYTLDGRYFHGKQGTMGDFDMQLLDGSQPNPEKQERIEIGLGADFASYFRPMVTWFDIETKNAKSASATTYELDGATYYYYTESDELRRGVELLIQGRIGKNTSYKVSWTHLLENESTSNGVTTDAIGVSTPENLYALVLNHRWGAYSANLSIKQVDEWTSSSSPMGVAEYGGLGDYTRVDANIRRNFKFSHCLLTVTLFGRNLGDDHYATRYVTGYYPDRGRTLGTEISLAF